MSYALKRSLTASPSCLVTKGKRTILEGHSPKDSGSEACGERWNHEWAYLLEEIMTRVLTVAAFLLAASATSAATLRPTASPPLAANGGWMAKHANAKHPWLYVNGPQHNVVLIYDLAQVGVPQIGRITQGLNQPTGMAIDASGTLYVANYYGGNVAVYPAGSTVPSMTLTQGLTVPNGVAVDTNGDVYVSDKGSPPSILMYPRGQTYPSEKITSALIQNPGQLSFDSSRDLFLSDGVSGVSEVTFGSQQPVSLNLQGLTAYDGAVAVDPLNDDVLVSGVYQSSHTVMAYAPGTVNPARVLQTGAWVDFLGVGDLRKTEYVFAPDSASNEVLLFKHNSNKVAGMFRSVRHVRGVAYKPAGVP
jgi:hypothetical protein